MTTYVITNGDLLKAATSFNLINAFAHGANCWSVMGAGIANHVRLDFPEIYRADQLDERGPEQRLGNMSYAFDHDTGVWGFNLYTQFYSGPNARMPSIISSVQIMFEQVHDIIEAKTDETVYVGLPAIGCGIGGLKLFHVVSQINKIADTIFEDTRRRVVPVFYIRQGDGFEQDLQELSQMVDYGISVVASEEDIIEEEGIG
ncbi:hypothetical protein [Salmonella phage PST-D24]|nr:hypothetical protein [Salmonella phage PST-D24]